jgi:hypothetical protein
MMVGTFFDYKAPTPEQANPWNSVLSKALEQYQGITKARYARPQAEADILSKTLTPLAALSTSPMAQGFAGPQGDQARQLLSSILSQYGGGLGGGQQQHQGLLSHLAQALHLQSRPEEQAQAQQPQQEQQGASQTNPIQQSYMNQARQAKISGGKPYYDENGQLVIPPENYAEHTQALTGEPNIKSLLPAYIKASKPFLQPSGEGKLLKSELAGGLQKVFGLEKIPEKLGGAGYAEKNAERQRLKAELERELRTHYGLSQKEIHDVLTERPGEGDKAFEKREMKELKRLLSRGKQANKIIGEQGIKIDNDQEESFAPENTTTPQGAMEMFQLPDGRQVTILAEKHADFLKKYPGAKPL